VSDFTAGIDVSAAQSFEIDWQRVRAAGKRFVYVKANTGEGKRDPWFERHARGASAAGLLVGAYHFALVDDDPSDDLDAFLEAVSGVAIELPSVFDLETRNGADALGVLSFVDGWVERHEARVGRSPVPYLSPGFWNALGAPARSERYASLPLFVAQYGVGSPSPVAPWGAKWTLWQSHGNTIAQLLKAWVDPGGKAHEAGAQLWGTLARLALAVPETARLLAAGGSCAGVAGEVDLDVFAGSYDALRRWAGLPVAELPTLADDPRVRLDPGHERVGS